MAPMVMLSPTQATRCPVAGSASATAITVSWMSRETICAASYLSSWALAARSSMILLHRRDVGDDDLPRRDEHLQGVGEHVAAVHGRHQGGPARRHPEHHGRVARGPA